MTAANDSTSREIASPCINICQLNAQQICCGCGRNLTEIGAWTQLNAEDKARVVKLAKLRLARLK